MAYISLLLLFFSFFRMFALSVCRHLFNKYYYIQRRGVTLKSNRSRLLKIGPIDRSYRPRSCVTITSSGVCFVSKQLASTSFRRQVLSTLLVQRWRDSSANVRLSNPLISSCYLFYQIYTVVQKKRANFGGL